jgi:hypothetical protein
MTSSATAMGALSLQCRPLCTAQFDRDSRGIRIISEQKCTFATRREALTMSGE